MISKIFIDSHNSYDEFVTVTHALRECNKMKKEIKIPENAVKYTLEKEWKCIASIVRKIPHKTDKYFYLILLFVVRKNQR